MNGLRWALVTGGASGMGLATVERLARDGFSVAFADRDAVGVARETARLSAQGLAVRGHVLDLTDEAATRALVNELPPLYALVNNAGLFDERRFDEVSSSDFRRAYEVNLVAVSTLTQVSARRMAGNGFGGGRIVNIASIAGLFPFHGQANYAAAKAGVIALTKVLAKELARRGITANAIAPGVIATTMVGDIKPEVLQGYLQQIPVGRLGKPEDVANAVLFLSSEESGYITGQVLPVTGGWF